jgi:hypothetical protein
MGGVDWAARTCGRDDPLNRAARLRGHVTFCRYNDDGLLVTADAPNVAATSDWMLGRKLRRGGFAKMSRVIEIWNRTVAESAGVH